MWELFLRPLFPRIGDLFLGIVTFGIERLQDQIYLDVAQGRHERASGFTLIIVITLLSGYFIDKLAEQAMLIRKVMRLEKRITHQSVI